MKENFIELTQDKIKVLINLENVCKVIQYPKEKHTAIYFNCPNDKGVFITAVDETYEEIKTMIGKGTPDFKYREV